MNAPEATDGTSIDALIASSHAQPVFLEFWIDGCPHCRRMAPVMGELVAAYTGRVQVAEYQIRTIDRTVRRFQVSRTPTLLLIDRGAVVWRHEGFLPMDALSAELDPLLAGLDGLRAGRTRRPTTRTPGL